MALLVATTTTKQSWEIFFLGGAGGAGRKEFSLPLSLAMLSPKLRKLLLLSACLAAVSAVGARADTGEEGHDGGGESKEVEVEVVSVEKVPFMMPSKVRRNGTNPEILFPPNKEEEILSFLCYI